MKNKNYKHFQTTHAMFAIIKIIPLVLILNNKSINGARNNICKNFWSYFTIDINENCYYNPDVGATPEQVARHYGYPFENHTIITEDGYILNLFRIPHDNLDLTVQRQPVFMHHGISTDSTYFFSVRNNSLPFLLSDAGYDVWLANARGTKYSLGHISLSANERKFWDFSFHEMAIYDVPAAINLIQNQNRSNKKIIYLGHSMGTSVGYIYATLKKDEAKKYLSGLVCLAPVAFLGHVKGLSAIIAPFAGIIEAILKIFDIYVFLSPYDPGTKLMHYLGSKFPIFVIKLFLTTFTYGSYPIQEFNYEAAPIQFSCTPTTFSVKSLVHYGQSINHHGKFQFFDYGKRKNLELYQSKSPPNYNISEINIPVYLYYGKNDFLATEKDVKYLYDQLTIEQKLIVAEPKNHPTLNFNHVDFIFGKNIEKLFYKRLIQTMKDLV